MGKVKCYSVRLQSLTPITDKAYKAKGYDGSVAILPKSQVFMPDYEVQKSEAWWIAAWILEKKELQYSDKKIGWYNPETDRVEPNYTGEDYKVEKHIPERIEPISTIPNPALVK